MEKKTDKVSLKKTEFFNLKHLIKDFYKPHQKEYSIGERQPLIENYFKPTIVNLENDDDLEDWDIIHTPNNNDDLLKSYVIVEDDFISYKNNSKIIKQPLLDLELLNITESKQPQRRFKDCTVYHYTNKTVDQVFKNFTNPNDCTVRGLVRIVPDIVKDSKIISTCLIHGTSGDKNPGYFDPKSQLFQAYLNCAMALALLEGRKVDLKSIKWNGSHFGKNRQRAGKEFSRYIEAWHWFYEYSSVMAFSHGANLSIIASNDLKKAEILFGLFFGCPVRDYIRIYGPDNIPLILNNYSWDDPIQKMGYFTPLAWLLAWLYPKRRDLCRERIYEGGRLFNKHEETILTNISISNNLERPRHGTIAKTIAPHLPKLIQYMLSVYKNREALHNLSLNIVPDKYVDTYGVQKYNLTIQKADTEKEKKRQNKIPEKHHDFSKKLAQEHKFVYQKEKDKKYWLYTQYRLLKNFFKDTFYSSE